MSSLESGKRVADSQTTLSLRMQQEHANPRGKVHGGELMKLIDEAGGICAMRHARHQAVTVEMDSLKFMEPVNVGDLVVLNARLNYVGTTSMETEISIKAEDILTGKITHTNNAYAVFVALDENERPIRVPSLILETPEELKRYEEGKQRQIERIAKKT